MLTDAVVKNSNVDGKAKKLFDGGGLFLLLTPTKEGVTSKRWRFKFIYGGKEKLMALGMYPEVSLAAARKRRGAARALLDEGIDPAAAKQNHKRQTISRLENTFSAVAEDWIKTRCEGWSPRYTEDTSKIVARELAPAIGARPVTEISPPELLHLLRKIEQRDAPAVAEKALSIAGQVFRHSVRIGALMSDPSRDLRGALKSRAVKHHARLSEAELPAYLGKVESYAGAPVTTLGLRLLLLTALRTQELRFAKWPEIDIASRLWRVPGERMKSRREHLVPLSDQAIDAIEALWRLSGKRPYAFPNEHHPGSKPMSENAILYALYRMGYHGRLTGHGFRSMFSTIAHESNLFDSQAIELQLAHSDKDKVRSIYNAAQYLRERARLMQWWADHLDELRNGSPQRVVAIASARR